MSAIRPTDALEVAAQLLTLELAIKLFAFKVATKLIAHRRQRGDLESSLLRGS